MKNEFPIFFFFSWNFAFFFEFFMKACLDFATNSRKEWRVSLFQSNLRKQIRKLPKILKSVKIIHYYSLFFIRVLIQVSSSSAEEQARQETMLASEPPSSQRWSAEHIHRSSTTDAYYRLKASAEADGGGKDTTLSGAHVVDNPITLKAGTKMYGKSGSRVISYLCSNPKLEHISSHF